MQESRVQLPLGALDRQDVGKPGIPRASGARERGFKSRRPDFVIRCTRVGSRDRPVKPTWRMPHRWFESSHRSLWIRKVKPTGDGSRPESGRAMSLESSTLSPSAFVPLADRQRHQPSKLARRVRFPQGTLTMTMIGDRLVVGFLALNQETEVRPLLPELATRPQCLDDERDAESSNGRMRRSERLHVGSIPASAASDTRQRKSSGRMRSLS